MKKKLLSLLLAATMLTGTLTGCGKENENTTTPTPTVSAAPTTDATPTPAANGEGTGATPSVGGEEISTAPEIEIQNIRDLSNPNATAKAQLVYDYLCSVSGQGIISGQEESCGAAAASSEMNYLKKVTGKYPAIRGLDFINDDFEGVVDRSIFWSNSMHGLVCLSWHWGTPPDGVGYESSKGTIDLSEALTEGTDLHNALLADLDEAAGYLKELQDANVVVLWKPFHEFDGEWFWWGKGGSENFIKLWQLMYDRYTNYHGLNNLIWVLAYSSGLKDGWYPGAEYVDILGADSYATGTRSSMYKRSVSFAEEGMPIPLHECDHIPMPDEMISGKVHWTWFMTWTLSYLKENTKEELDTIYNHEYVITLDELPDFDVLLAE
ncbi:MAG: hypothetical protein IJY09_06585 [Lachnospiraceae bacterium]|nr:hypothetical protein [Lachnospiraceae bacterium]